MHCQRGVMRRVVECQEQRAPPDGDESSAELGKSFEVRFKLRARLRDS